MAELITPTGRVHWIGTGMSTGSGLGLVCEGASTVLWGRTVEKAETCLARLGLQGKAATRAYDAESLAAELAAGDIVVSMVPVTEHPTLVEIALEQGAHFVCSSYVSPGISLHAGTAVRRGSVLLTEIGLDPGIDHLLAHALVRKAKEVTGDLSATVRFTSYCGANPAVPNDFRYRFSWAPRGVLTALLTPARLIEDSVERVVDRPWEAVAPRVVGSETFEVYPNRDSVSFIETYAFPAAWTVDTFVRGTMRLDGWSAAWKPIFDELPVATHERITELAEELAARYPTTPADHDRVVMSVKLDVEMDTGQAWSGEYVLDAVGDATEGATPRLVSVPLACAILDIADGRMGPGLHQASDTSETAQRWLNFLRVHGISATYRGA
ncbi:saccharopine dehydrogenase C-terminal domain-containing protein [Streptomyces sp. KR80]|uniref:saccharopine dehydrogenase C-terminal domain-containing protein n=1 Tax=Streptomyces sp. KR80 TaxID=3457426 RepID=UPI003FD4A907